MTDKQANELIRNYNNCKDSDNEHTKGIAVGIGLALIIMGYDFEREGTAISNGDATAVIRRFGRFGGK